MKYELNKFPKNKKTDLKELSENQIIVRNNLKIYVYKKSKTCNKCFFKQPINEFYVKNKETGRRSNSCRDCQMKNDGVVELGKQRFSDVIFKKGFRRCSACKNIKPLNDFTKNRSNAGGIANTCYKCSKKLHDDYIKEGRDNLTDFYVREYGKRNGVKKFNIKIIESLRNEIIESRKDKYFLDGKSFLTMEDFAEYIFKEYGNPLTMTKKRINEGKTEKDCVLSENEMRSKAYTKGAVKVTDMVTGDVFVFKNTTDSNLKKMFSKSTVIKRIKNGGITKIKKSSIYKNPCTIERI